MKKITPFLLVFIFVLCASFIHAQENKDYTIEEEGIRLGPGMERKRVGGINLRVPKGAEVYQDGPNVIMEELEEYIARKFKEMEDRIGKIEKNQEELNKEIKRLKEIIKSSLRKPK